MLSMKTPLHFDIRIADAVFTPHTVKTVTRLGNSILNRAVDTAVTANEVGLWALSKIASNNSLKTWCRGRYGSLASPRTMIPLNSSMFSSGLGLVCRFLTLSNPSIEVERRNNARGRRDSRCILGAEI